jgi:tRNA (guanine6-N2)-methyltransferase
MRFLLTTDPGIEDLVVDEVQERLPDASVHAEPYATPGQVRVETDAVDELFRLATIHHVVQIHAEAEALTLADIRRIVDRVELPEMTDAESFRVTTESSGEHDFTRREIQGAAGAVIQKRYGTRVSLDEFDVNVRVDLYGGHLIAGVQRTARSLSKRIKRTKVLRTSIKPTIAAAMVRLAGAHRGAGRLIDPLCGTGNIPIEAKRMNPRLEVFASDWDGGTVQVARGTIANHDLAIDVRTCDARSLRAVHAAPFDYIVTDPPYGVRLGRRSGVAALYRSLLPSFEEVLTQTGRIVLVVLKFRTFLGALEQSGLKVLSERVVGVGELRPRVLVLTRE